MYRTAAAGPFVELLTDDAAAPASFNYVFVQGAGYQAQPDTIADARSGGTVYGRDRTFCRCYLSGDSGYLGETRCDSLENRRRACAAHCALSAESFLSGG